MLVEQAARVRKTEVFTRLAKPLLGLGLLTSEGELHERQRRCVSPSMTPRRVADYGGAMVRHLAGATRSWVDKGTIDVGKELSTLTFGIAAEAMFGADCAHHAPAIRSAVDLGTAWLAAESARLIHLPLWWPTLTNRRLKRALTSVDGVVKELVRRPDSQTLLRDDLLSQLRAHAGPNGLSDSDPRAVRQQRDEVLTLLVAGLETTANALSWALFLLATHREVAERVAEEARSALEGRPPAAADLPRLPLALQVFKETLRLYPPAFHIGREALQPVRIREELLGPGEVAIVNVYGLHRRPDLFANPERFDPDRFSPQAERVLPRGAYLPFGDGPRGCVGEHFALLEGQLALAQLSQTLRFELVGSQMPTARAQITLRPQGDLRLRVARRSS